MTTSTETRAVTGRRVEFTYYRDLPDGPAHPGIITETAPGIGDDLLAVVRLDGKRSTLDVPVDYQGLRYLDEVVDVPELPTGPFTPTVTCPTSGGFKERAGVLVTGVGEDGEDLIAITTDRAKAEAAIRARAVESHWDVDYLDFNRMKPRWGVFDWVPADPDQPWAADDWFVRWDAVEGDDQAVHIYHLPA